MNQQGVSVKAPASLAAILISLASACWGESPRIDGTWNIATHVGEDWFGDSKDIVGSAQVFGPGSDADGPFFSCDGGMSMGYHVYDIDSFAAVPDFSDMFALVIDDIAAAGDNIFVHRITCTGTSEATSRRNLYPFVTAGENHGWYPFNGGLFSFVLVD